MCTMIVHQAKIDGRGKGANGWFKVEEANVSYDHPYELPLEHALNIDFVNEAEGPGARVAVELSVAAARKLVKTIEAVLAQAESRGVLEDMPAGGPRKSLTRAGWIAALQTSRVHPALLPPNSNSDDLSHPYPRLA